MLFLFEPEAWATLAKKPQDRSIPLRDLAQKLGGQLVGLYYCFGEYDGVALAEIPDDTSAIATSLAAVSPGYIKAIKTTRLFSVEETMEAMRKAGTFAYQGPSSS
ncbi:MAG: GYD domain-containing protein [Ktedonobacteraceae bacterium]